MPCQELWWLQWPYGRIRAATHNIVRYQATTFQRYAFASNIISPVQSSDSQDEIAITGLNTANESNGMCVCFTYETTLGSQTPCSAHNFRASTPRAKQLKACRQHFQAGGHGAVGCHLEAFVQCAPAQDASQRHRSTCAGALLEKKSQSS